MFSEWLEWVPGDHRGSTKYPTLEILKTAINKSGLGATAATLSVTTSELSTNPLLRADTQLKDVFELQLQHLSDKEKVSNRSVLYIMDVCLKRVLT